MKEKEGGLGEVEPNEKGGIMMFHAHCPSPNWEKSPADTNPAIEDVSE